MPRKTPITFGIQEKHRDLGTEYSFERRGKPVFTGICDRVEIQPAIYRNVNTGKKTADKKIRLRLKPPGARAIWTGWMPYRKAK